MTDAWRKCRTYADVGHLHEISNWMGKRFRFVGYHFHIYHYDYGSHFKLYIYTFTDHKPLASIYLPIHVQQHRQRINNRCFNEFTMATITLWKNTWITLFIEKIHPPYGINMDFYSNTKSTILLDKLNARLCNKEGKMIFPSGQRTKRLILYSWNHFIADITSLDSTLCFKSI